MILSSRKGWPVRVSQSSVEGLSEFRELILREAWGVGRGNGIVQHLIGSLSKNSCASTAVRADASQTTLSCRPPAVASCRATALSPVLWWRGLLGGGLERFPELPTFSGVMADFIQELILFEEGRGRKDSIDEAADALEREALAGQILSTQPHSGGFPEFVYRPSETEEDIRLTRASSMVSELAPVVLFLRGTVSPGDMLIIEEPEAHLHPAAQTQMARTLARLVRAGVRVVVTTHSDWLLMEIANLMREGELDELTR